jgi:hypothetical protein
MGYNNDNLAYNSLASKYKASEKESERLLNEIREIEKKRNEIRASSNVHLFIKRFCDDHLRRLGVEFIQSNFSGLSRTYNRCNGWFYKLQSEPVDTKYGKMYLGLIVSVANDRLDDVSAMFQECLIQIDETKKENPIVKVGLGMWHLWDGECFKEIDDCPLGRKELYCEQNFDKFVKTSFLKDYIKL